MTEYGLQMYSVRDVAETDLCGALRRVAEMGYRYIEFAGFFGNDAKDVRTWLDELGLVACSTHTGLDALTPDKIQETVRYHKVIGCNSIVIPGASWSSEEKLEANIALMNQAQRTLAAEGITLAYHNHSSEFYIRPYGKAVYDEVLSRTDLLLEVDTFWLFHAGFDPVEYCEKLKHRIRMIHLKDGVCGDIGEPRTFSNAEKGAKGCSLGQGDAPVKEIRAWALKNGVRMIVESEGLEPTGPQEVQRCITYLHSL